MKNKYLTPRQYHQLPIEIKQFYKEYFTIQLDINDIPEELHSDYFVYNKFYVLSDVHVQKYRLRTDRNYLYLEDLTQEPEVGDYCLLLNGIDKVITKETNATSIIFENNGLMFDRHKFHKIVHHTNPDKNKLLFDYNLYINDLTNNQLRNIINQFKSELIFSISTEVRILLEMMDSNLYEQPEYKWDDLKDKITNEILERFINKNIN